MVKHYKPITYTPPYVKVKDLRPRRVLCTSGDWGDKFNQDSGDDDTIGDGLD